MSSKQIHIPGLIGIIIISINLMIALFSYLLAPDSSPFANEMHLELSTLRPGEEVKFLQFKREAYTSVSPFNKFLSGEKTAYKSIPIDTVYQLSDGYVYKAYNGNQIHALNRDVLFNETLEESIFIRRYYLGTDTYGRDLLSRLMVATRISLSVGFIAVFISLFIGVLLGLLAGYYGGWIDHFIMWLINVVWSIPTLLMVIAISLALGKGFWQVFVAVGLTMWVEVARVVRGQVLSIKNMEYIQATKVMGFSDFRIMIRHILPNCISPIIVISAANFASAILIEAGLSFLGIGAQAPMPSWGAMIKNHYSYIILDKAYLAIAPGMAILLLVLAFMLVGTMLRERLDVRA